MMVATEIVDLARRRQVSVEGDAVDLEKWGRLGQPEVIPLWMLKYLPNMPACHTSIFLDAQGPNNTITAKTPPACWRSARRIGSSCATAPTSSWSAACEARSTR